MSIKTEDYYRIIQQELQQEMMQTMHMLILVLCLILCLFIVVSIIFCYMWQAERKQQLLLQNLLKYKELNEPLVSKSNEEKIQE